MKKVLVTGSSGYVGNYFAKTIAKAMPSVQVVGVSRRGGKRNPEQPYPDNLTFSKGNCFEPDSLEPHLSEADALVHCVGVISTVTDKEDRKSNYYGNCVSLTSPAGRMYQSDKKRKVVMVSSMTSPFFMKDYLVTKREAEKFLTERSDKFATTILRPGLIWHLEQRKWGIIFYPLYSKLYYNLYSALVKKEKIEDINWLQSLITPLPTSLDIMAKRTVEALQKEQHHEPVIIDAYEMAQEYFES